MGAAAAQLNRCPAEPMLVAQVAAQGRSGWNRVFSQTRVRNACAAELRGSRGGMSAHATCCQFNVRKQARTDVAEPPQPDGMSVERLAAKRPQNGGVVRQARMADALRMGQHWAKRRTCGQLCGAGLPPACARRLPDIPPWIDEVRENITRGQLGLLTSTTVRE